ncbi:glucose 1-dehydrogenase [Nitrospiraceae bacterium HYJII51-Mn-bac16s-1-B09]|uniref:Glucose 1-dehydrogenase n=2 Tax=Candidatus Manganitrophus noduliformans TaxID=2606439 RepID=A0A7X6IAD3_9BACT|nr:glucose 1-dehydrogenase [Candidatus Manganitrophus noduliformans]
MKAIAVRPGQPNSVHLAEVPTPSMASIPDGRGVRVRMLRVGIDGTDKEINEGLYGAPPPGEEILVIGHEGFGRVEEVGSEVSDLSPDDYVVPMVRRPGGSLYDRIGFPDLSTDETYYERGINFLHGYLAEEVVDDASYLVKVPPSLKEVGVLVEPTTVAEKGWRQAVEIQRRLRLWRPQRTAVLGAGTIGLLATLIFRLRGFDVTTFARTKKPYLNTDLAEAVGARYYSTQEISLLEAANREGPFDMILEATGYSPLAFEAMEAVGKNGIIILSSVTGGDRKVEVPADRINLEFVLGNKVAVGIVSAGRDDFEAAVRDLAHAEAAYPGWLKRLLTHAVQGLENYPLLFNDLTEEKEAIKVYCDIAEF